MGKSFEDQPDRSAQLTIRAPSEGKHLLEIDQLLTIKVSSADTNGAYAVGEITAPPNSGPPGLHRHSAQETFYILDGQFRFDTLDGDAPRAEVAGPGSVVVIPSNIPHNYRIVSATPGRCLIVVSPGSFERFFEELGTPYTDPLNPPVPSGPPDLQHVLAVCARHDVEILGLPHR